MAENISDGSSGAFVVDIDGYEGPLDVLLVLAREQKVDLKEISIVQLAEQYLAFVAEVGRTNLELAAEYLVMAAWLAYLKSRLLLPEPTGAEEPSGEAMAAALIAGRPPPPRELYCTPPLPSSSEHFRM